MIVRAGVVWATDRSAWGFSVRRAAPRRVALRQVARSALSRCGGPFRRRALVGTRVAFGLLVAVGLAPALGGQAGNTAEVALTRALDLEASNKCREAIPLYRQAMGVEDPIGAVLGLERCYSMVGRPDSLLPLIDTLLARKPTDPTLRTVQLRTLATVRRDVELANAFDRWVALLPNEPGPYRSYAQVLLEMGRARGADTVLQRAAKALGGTSQLAGEFAQMQAALQLWVPSAQSWREAGASASYLEAAAVFSLMPVPIAMRDSVRAVFAAPPVTLSARRVLSGLELKWHAPRDAWGALAALPVGDSVIAAWAEFAREAEGEESWLTARDAYARAFAAKPQETAWGVRAARSAMAGGDALSALALIGSLKNVRDSATMVTVGLLEVQALGSLGRVDEAQQALGKHAKLLDDAAYRVAQRTMAWGWIRKGDLAKADQALEAVGRFTEDGERVAAWLSLYQGDLKTARRGLRRTDEASNDVVTAMALLSRTRAESSVVVGRAFLALARGDTVVASSLFAVAADTLLGEAAPFLIGVSARLALSRRDTARALSQWEVVGAKHADSPEAAEAELGWARVLRVRGDTAGAIAKLEHLILTWPQSALIPQARRELDLAKGLVPPTGPKRAPDVGEVHGMTFARSVSLAWGAPPLRISHPIAKAASPLCPRVCSFLA